MASHVRWWFEDAGEAALDELRRGLAIAEELDEPGLRMEGHGRLGTLLYNVGELEQAEEEVVSWAALAAEVASLRDQARATTLLGLVKYHRGELAEAERLGLQARDWLERTADSFYQLQNMRALGLGAAARSDLDLAEQRLREAIALALELGGGIAVEMYRCLIDVLIGQGRLGDARALAQLALRDLQEKDLYARAAGLLIRARLATAEGARDEACECFVEALRLLDQQRMPLEAGEARVSYAHALRRLGDEPGAETELRSARVTLSRLGARGLVEEIDRELAALTEGAGQAGPLSSS